MSFNYLIHTLTNLRPDFGTFIGVCSLAVWKEANRRATSDCDKQTNNSTVEWREPIGRRRRWDGNERRGIEGMNRIDNTMSKDWNSDLWIMDSTFYYYYYFASACLFVCLARSKREIGKGVHEHPLPGPIITGLANSNASGHSQLTQSFTSIGEIKLYRLPSNKLI